VLSPPGVVLCDDLVPLAGDLAQPLCSTYAIVVDDRVARHGAHPRPERPLGPVGVPRAVDREQDVLHHVLDDGRLDPAADEEPQVRQQTAK